MNLTDRELASRDILRLNLFCAVGLPGTEGINFRQCIGRLEHWTKYIDHNIRRWWPGFVRAPRPGEDSPGKFRMLAIATLLAKELGIQYNRPFSEGEYDGRDSRNLFVHGLLSGFGGTCVSLPVLYIAIGRRLGFPLWLVKTREHLFARWEETGGERFNIECTCPGFASPSDDYYRRMRGQPTDREMLACGLMRNLTPREELACFLNERGNCLADHLRLPEAIEAYYHAHHLVPNDGVCRGNWVLASVMHRMLVDGLRWAESQGRQSVNLRELRPIVPSDAHEAWAAPLAVEMFARIMRMKPWVDIAPSSAV